MTCNMAMPAPVRLVVLATLSSLHSQRVSAILLLPSPCLTRKTQDGSFRRDGPLVQFDNRLDMIKSLVTTGSVLAEVGVFAGEFARSVYDAVHPSTLYLVDPWPAGEIIQSGDVNGANLQDVRSEDLLQSVLTKFENRTAGSRVVIAHDYSASFLASLGVGSLDAIYLDGDHTFGGVMADLILAACAVKPGGWIMGHDYAANPEKAPSEALEYPNRFGVNKAVTRLLALTGFQLHAVANDGLVSYAILRV